MCQYIKDNGEQCGMDVEPFCRHHEDSEQAADFHADSTDDTEFVSAAFSGEQRDFDGAVMETTCDQCETPLRRTERLREHPNVNRRTTVEAVVKCDCAERVIASTSILSEDMPNGWQL